MTSNRDRAAAQKDNNLQMGETMADMTNVAVEWMAQILWRTGSGQHEITEGRGASKDEALADARAAHRMLATAEEHDRGFARRHVTDWEEVHNE